MISISGHQEDDSDYEDLDDDDDESLLNTVMKKALMKVILTDMKSNLLS